MIKTWNKAAAVNLAKPLNLQLIIILLSCLCVAAAQGGGFLRASHYTQVLILACIFLAYLGLLFYMKVTKRLIREDSAVTW